MKFQAFLFAFVLGLLFPLLSIAQEVPAPHFLDGVLGFLQNGWLQTGAVLLFETFLRLKPTAKPASLLIIVKYTADGVVIIFGWLSAVTDKLIESANRVKP